MISQNCTKYILLILSTSLELSIVELNFVKDNIEDRRKGN